MPRTTRLARAFTLIELLVVILLIAIIIAITLPALGAARNAVRRAETRQLMQNFQNAWGVFKGDYSRSPGLFTQRDLGAEDNGEAGFSAMENAILEMLGSDALIGIVSQVNDNPDAYANYDSGNDSIIRVGPSEGNEDLQAYVNAKVLGSGDAYLQLDERALVAQINDGGDTVGQFGTPATDSTGQRFANTGNEGVLQMPDVVDAFGQPLLLWVADEFAPAQISTESMDDALDGFILDNADADDPRAAALFYPNANKAFLAATRLGRLQYDMTSEVTPINERTSIIGFKSTGDFDDEQRESFMALLGNPAFPSAIGGERLADAVRNMMVVPASPRGEFIIHSAGPDGVYFANTESGFRTRGSTTGKLEYWQHFSAGSNEIDTTDMAGFFDDVMLGAN